ncbi:MAG: RDD family protein [Caldilineaceae bacterium]
MNDSAGTSVAYQDFGDNDVTVIGFNRRLLAALYDGFLVAFLTFIIAFAIGFLGIFIDMFRPTSDARMQAIILIAGLIFSLVYFTVSWGRSGQTIGMGLTGIKVVRTDGTRLGYGKAFLRYVGYVISALLLSLGFLWIGFDKRRQGWHDKIAGTLVTLSDDDFAGEEATFTPSDSGSSKWVWIVVWFVFALVAPASLVGGALWVLGPVVRRALQ